MTRPRAMRRLLTGTAVLLAAAVTSGCFTTQAQRDYARNDGSIPWWCQANGAGPDLTEQECLRLSIYLDVAIDRAQPYPTLGDAQAAGATAIANTPVGVGYAVSQPGGPAQFQTAGTNVLLYNGNTPDARLAGVAWRLFGDEPLGYEGSRDDWSFEAVSGTWWLPLWIVRGYHNHSNVFAPSQPCLLADVVPADTSEACFQAAHTQPLEIVVTNDDGYGAEGIYALVDALAAQWNVDVKVVAPGANQSGSGDAVTAEGFVVSATTETMGSAPGNTYDATAIWSTDPDRPNGSGSPADAVNWALDVMNLSPDLVLSGINEGQNHGRQIANISGTVGAARTARLAGFPAIATSQGGATLDLTHPDFPAGVAVTLAVLNEWRLGIRQPGVEEVPSINTPSCQVGSAVRGILDVPVAPSFTGLSYSTQDCTSTLPAESITSDVQGMNNGFATVADVTTEDIPAP